MSYLYDRRILAVSLAILGLSCLSAAASSYPKLRDRLDAEIQFGLEQAVANLGLMPAIQRKQLSVALVDITQLAQPRVATINGDEMFYAASLPKIAILLGAFVLIERGEMTLDAETRESLTQMIRVSSNRAATQVLRRVGKPKLAEILQSNRYNLYDPSMNGGLWVGKDYGKIPAWKRDPLYHLSHAATALQTARFYYLLATRQLVAPELCEIMQEMLAKPALQHKFVKGLQARPGARIYRKSGTWKDWHVDSAWVEYDSHQYIAVALAHHPKGGQWLSKLIVALDDLVVRSQPRGVEIQ